MNVHDVIRRLRNVTGNGPAWRACCPAHDDQNASLSVKEGHDGRVLFYCHAGCSFEGIASALQVHPCELTGGAVAERTPAPTPTISRLYDYTDEAGRFLFQVCRMTPKDFRQRRLDGHGGWIWNTKGVRRVPYRLPKVIDTAAASGLCLICEGEKDVEAAEALGFVATCNAGGAGKWLPEFSACLAGAHVVVIADKDKPGRRHAAAVAVSLHGRAASIKVVELPDHPGRAVKDLSDWIQGGGTAGDLQCIMERAPVWAPPPDACLALPDDAWREPEMRTEDEGAPLNALPMVTLASGPVGHLEVAHRLADIIAPHHVIFVRFGEVVRLVDGCGSPQFEELGPAAACSELERFSRFQRWNRNAAESRAAVLNETATRIILRAPEFLRRLPQVRRILDYPAPVMHDGKVVVVPAGYSPELETWTNPRGPQLELPPTVAEAVEGLGQLLDGFCFEEGPPAAPDLYRMSALAYLLTCHCRGLFEPERAPVFYAEGNRPGCGKDYLLGLGHVLITGGEPEFIAPAADSDETRKRLFAAAKAGSRFVLISNMKGHLNDPSLEAFATSPAIADRVLGQSRNCEYPNTGIYGISGNALTFSEDFARRCLRLKLAYYGETIETRPFRVPDLYGHVRERRGFYLGCLQRLVENWAEKGSPPGSTGKPGFTRWAQVIGGILEAAGVRNPIGRDTIVSVPNEEAENVGRLLAAQHEKTPGIEFEVIALRQTAAEMELFSWLGDLTTERSAQTRFGKIIRAHARREFGGLYIQQHGDGKRPKWAIHKAEDVGMPQ